MNVRTEIERAVRAAAPHALVETVRAALAAAYDARSVELLLADYGMTVLKPVGSAPGRERTLSMHNSPQGRAFGSQLPHEEPAGAAAPSTTTFPSPYGASASASSPSASRQEAPPRGPWTS